MILNMENFEEEKRNFEIISGNGENLDISPVYSHIPVSKPNTANIDKKIVIPMQNNLS